MEPVPSILSLEEFEAIEGPSYLPPFVSKFGALYLDELDAPGPEHEFLIDGLLTKGERSIIGGPSRSGKSFIGIHAGLCIAHGLDFMGFKVEPGLVIYQAGEGARGVKKRLRAWRRHFGIEYSRETPFVLLQAAVDLYHPEGDTAKLIAEILAIAAQFKMPLRAVFIDTLATATSGADENSGKDMSTVMANVAKINAATGAHVCLIHHMNAGGTKLRGHTSIYANVDQVILVRSDETTKVKTAVLDKQKDGGGGLILKFELMQVILGRDKNNKEITSCVCLAVGEKETYRRTEEAKGLRINDGEILFMQALFEADKKYGQAVPTEMHVPGSVRSVVKYDDMKRIYASMSPSDTVIEDLPDDETPDPAAVRKRYLETLKNRLQRAREYLSGAGIIGLATPFIWWTGKPLRAFPQTLPRREKEPEEDQGALDIGEIPF